MKGFTRRETRFSLCGLKCGLCRMRLDGYCPGCGGGEGNQSCAIARCSLGHGCPEFCCDCPEYPCALYEGFDAADSFIPHSCRARDLAEARSLGLGPFLERLGESEALLAELLRDYNDGRRKTLFCTAACLLPVEELRDALEKLRAQAGNLGPKERAALAARLLNDAAEARGLSLRLVKKA